MSKKSKMIRMDAKAICNGLRVIERYLANDLCCNHPQQFLTMKAGRGKRFIQFSLKPEVSAPPEHLLYLVTDYIKIKMFVIMNCPPISWETLSDRAVYAEPDSGPIWGMDVVHSEDHLTANIYFNIDEA